MNYFSHSLLFISNTNVWELFLFWHVLLLLNKLNRFKIRLHTENQLPRLPGSALKVPAWVVTRSCAAVLLFGLVEFEHRY